MVTSTTEKVNARTPIIFHKRWNVAGFLVILLLLKECWRYTHNRQFLFASSIKYQLIPRNNASSISSFPSNNRMAEGNLEEDLWEYWTVFRTSSAILKLCQWAIEIVCTVLIALSFENNGYHLFYMNMVVTFLVGNTCLLLTCLIIRKPITHAIFEIVYNAVAGFLLFAASITLLLSVLKPSSLATTTYYTGNENQIFYLIASALGIIIVTLCCANEFVLRREVY